MDKNISIINSHIFLNKYAWTEKVYLLKIAEVSRCNKNLMLSSISHVAIILSLSSYYKVPKFKILRSTVQSLYKKNA